MCSVLHMLGWEYKIPEMREYGISYANIHVVNTLRKQFPELLPIGQQNDPRQNLQATHEFSR